MANQRTRRVANKTIKLCTINICGFSSRSKFTLNKFIKDEGIDILSVLETDSTDAEKLELENMSFISDTNKASNKGAALYTSDKYSVTGLETISKMSKSIDSCWGLVVIQNQRYIIGSVYAKLNYKPAIKEILNMLKAAKDKQAQLKASGVILTGDFNARHLSWGDKMNNEYGKQLVDSLDHSQYSICISKTPTFLCANGDSYIDFSIISNNIVDTVVSCATKEDVELFSGAPTRGHVPLITEITVHNQSKTSEVKEKLDLSKMHWCDWTQSIENSIEAIRDTLESTQDPHTLWTQINRIITKATEDHGETKRCSPHSKPYWTSSLSTLSEDLQLARRCYIKRNTERNQQKLNVAKEKIDEERKKACQDFLIERAKKLNSVQAQHFWKEFNKIFQKKTVQKIDPLDDGAGGVLTDKKDLENCLFTVFFEAKHLVTGNFDDVFYTEVNNLYDEIINAESAGVDQGNGDEDLHNLNRDVTEDEFIKAIKYTGKSVDNNNFHPTMFRHLGNNAKSILIKLFNLCLVKRQWVWEAAEVIFLRKAGKDSYSKPGAYRPICITSYIGKLLEAVTAIRIELLLVNKNLTDPDQEGFSKCKNTIRYLNRLNLGIKVDKENYLTVLCLFIDFEKAFDSVWKKGMITKLHNLGIKGNIRKRLHLFT